MKTTTLFFLSLSIGLRLHAEAISVPEDCFAHEKAPCLIRVTNPQVLTSKTKRLRVTLSAHSIVKVKQFEQTADLQLLQGAVIVETGAAAYENFKLNDASFKSKRVFARLDGTNISVYDTKTFLLSEFEAGSTPQDETVMLKSEFLSKLDMVEYTAKFYPKRARLLRFLKNIERAWQSEFASQTQNQTKTIERSIASVKEREAERQRQLQTQAAEIKYVRERFFYRTFYR